MSQETASAWAWSIDRGWQSAADASISASSPALLFGETLFESFRAHQGKWLALSAHFSRLQASLDTWGWSSIPDWKQVESLLGEGLSRLGQSEAYARLTCWPQGSGAGPGLLPTTPAGWILMVSPLNGGEFMERPPAVVATAKTIGRDAWGLPYDFKHGNYLPSRLAGREARNRGLDDVVLCRRDGSPVEGSASNLLLFIGDRWLTPSLERDGLNGIARAALIERGQLSEQACTAEHLQTSTSMALVNSVRGLRFVERYDERSLELFGAATDLLRQAWRDVLMGWLAET